MRQSFTAQNKDPASVLYYEMVWSDWLGEGEAINSQTASSTDPDITIDEITQAQGIVRFKVGGGVTGKRVLVTVEISTSAGQTDQRTILIPIRDR